MALHRSSPVSHRRMYAGVKSDLRFVAEDRRRSRDARLRTMLLQRGSRIHATLDPSRSDRYSAQTLAGRQNSVNARPGTPSWGHRVVQLSTPVALRMVSHDSDPRCCGTRDQCLRSVNDVLGGVAGQAVDIAVSTRGFHARTARKVS